MEMVAHYVINKTNGALRLRGDHPSVKPISIKQGESYMFKTPAEYAMFQNSINFHSNVGLVEHKTEKGSKAYNAMGEIHAPKTPTSSDGLNELRSQSSITINTTTEKSEEEKVKERLKVIASDAKKLKDLHKDTQDKAQKETIKTKLDSLKAEAEKLKASIKVKA